MDELAFVVPLIGWLVLVTGIYLASAIGDASGVKDNRSIVIDEVAAFLRGRHWFALATFAALFLLIDRIKPWPFYYLENLPSGYGVMVDDLGPALLFGVVFYLALSLWDKARDARPNFLSQQNFRQTCFRKSPCGFRSAFLFVAALFHSVAFPFTP
ncbi:phosphatidylglycerophosphatase A [Ochrobactrum sp. AN78]|uniref:phosphatidylglycerophosphatase A family protein n=1 Tax=Ochrobactrum sp. AN78 TaxID=3039853 RepID=UPI002989AB6C|nr:phosphatidylglycerophosphatase A [Ochrobactrum sp. AN78]MDH7791612.1 hypothetical protein [Ochrobactrum sp. AN78]